MAEARSIEDLISPKVAEELGEGVIPTDGILIVKTMAADGISLRYLVADAPAWFEILGWLDSVRSRIQAIDALSWRALDEGDEP